MSVGKPPEGSDFTEHTVCSTLAYDGGLLKLRRDAVRLPDGGPAWREYVEHPGAVMMLAFLDAGTILLEHQYRYSMRRHYLELPAGKIDPGEPPEQTARRELVEECGYEAREWSHASSLHTCIGYSTERIELYVARDLKHVGAQLDPGEFLETFPVRMEDALAWVREGIITDTKTSFGLLWWDKWGNR